MTGGHMRMHRPYHASPNLLTGCEEQCYNDCQPSRVVTGAHCLTTIDASSVNMLANLSRAAHYLSPQSTCVP